MRHRHATPDQAVPDSLSDERLDNLFEVISGLVTDHATTTDLDTDTHSNGTLKRRRKHKKRKARK